MINRTFSDGHPGRSATCRSIFLFALEVAQPSFTRKEAAPNRIVRAFMNISMDEARDLPHE